MSAAKDDTFLKIIYYVRESEARYVTFSKKRCSFVVTCALVMLCWQAVSLVGIGALIKYGTRSTFEAAPAPAKAAPAPEQKLTVKKRGAHVAAPR